MATRKELMAAFDKMENERQAMLKKLSSYDASVLEKKPDPNSWSVTETAYHLKVAEESAVKYMAKKLEFKGTEKTTLGSAVKLGLLKAAVALPIKYKAPKVAQIPEGTNKSYAEAIEEWNEVRNALRTAYETVDENLIDHGLFKHPAAGKLNLLQAVSFMHKHMTRHFGQMERILKAVA